MARQPGQETANRTPLHRVRAPDALRAAWHPLHMHPASTMLRVAGRDGRQTLSPPRPTPRGRPMTRSAGTNPRQLGTSPRQLGTSPRALGTHPAAGSPRDTRRVANARRTAGQILAGAGITLCPQCDDTLTLETSPGRWAPCPYCPTIHASRAEALQHRYRWTLTTPTGTAPQLQNMIRRTAGL